MDSAVVDNSPQRLVPVVRIFLRFCCKRFGHFSKNSLLWRVRVESRRVSAYDGRFGP
jgi:hypothetical protein